MHTVVRPHPQPSAARRPASARRAWAAATLAALLLAGGCASTRLPSEPPKAQIHNGTGKDIVGLRWRACGSQAWLPLPVGTLASGRGTQVALPAPCVDLDAFWAEERLAGSQRNVRRDFPFTWLLR